MNNSVHVVAKVWYRLYWGLILLFGATLAAASAITIYLPKFTLPIMSEGYALGMPTLIIAGTTAFYCLTFYWVVQRRSQTMAMFVASLLFTLLLLDGLTLSAHAHGAWLFIGGWMISVLFTGIYGSQMLMGSVMLATVFILMDTKFHLELLVTQHLALLGGNIVDEALFE